MLSMKNSRLGFFVFSGMSFPSLFHRFFGQGGDEVFQPGRQIGLASAEIIVVMGMDGQGLVVALQIFCVVLLQGEEAVQAVAAFMQDEGGQQAGRAAVAVVVGVDGNKLVVDQGGDNWNRQAGSFRL